jgi:DNA-binding transcriptional LysR family regulator
MQLPNWDDLRLFLAVAREGRLLAAARRLTMDHSTVGRRISALETDVGLRLFDRSTRGVALTEAGQVLLEHAERVEAELLGAQVALGKAEETATGAVRLATPEAFGTYLVAPNIPLLRARHPGIQLELAPESQAVSLSKREADIAVTLKRPARGKMVARKLTDYRLGLYASSDYLAEHAPIDSLEDIRQHALVWYIDELIDLPELRYVDQIATGAQSVFRSSSIAAQQAAVAAGVGLGVLHIFAAEQDPRLVRVLPQLDVSRTYWLVLHMDMQRLPRIRAVVDFLKHLVFENRAHF